ncbi:hypothetical protein Mesau_02826 [Mesorhizobium australicum WSM2073]|uniref:Uncharacterized protein n=1 Tax=Mesorhizobium australicum (strain HAMBI 3006 / LMG 24608 / WSM2073) TaxID=754035 RepID=L0KMI3_MESAW|nr:hypothetical protein [Mesorhizobium australicum]AGB45219.1 hypothetical protein Mesau_02826 [Mesorhizobium australicum WSM2073]
MKGKTAVLAIALCGGIAGMAYSSGHRAGRISQLKNIVAAYHRRMGIEEGDDRLGRVDLCQEIGGLHEECTELAGN